MSKVFGTIAVVFLAAAAFVAYKNQDAYKKEIVTFQGEQATEKSTTKEFNGQVARLKTADEERKDLVTKEEEVATVLAEVTKKYNEAKKKVDALKDTHKSNETEITSAEDALKGLPDPDELIPKIKRMTSQLSQANSGIASEEAKLANLTRNDKNAQKRIDHLRNLIKLTTTGKSYPTLNTSISSVYRNWGFVILSAGDKQGVITGSTLEVKRGGETIAKLKVTAVEAGRAAADIVLESLAEGTTLQVGDKVVAEKEAAQPAAAATPAP
ncbi:MAG: hypothetical protein AB8F34_04485 [Akkermansiaceae bacterium]